MSDSIKFSHKSLFDFYKEYVENNLETFGNRYKKGMGIRNIGQSYNIRKNLISDYLTVIFDADVTCSSISSLITKIADALKTQSQFRTFPKSLLIETETPKKIRKRHNESSVSNYSTSESFLDRDESMNITCRNSHCEKHKNELMKEIELLKAEKNKLLLEVEDLKNRKTASELKSWDYVHPKFVLKCHSMAMSVRQVQGVMQFLKEHVECLADIWVPSIWWIHDQRWMLPTLWEKQKEEFIQQSVELTLALDGTEYNGSFMAIVLINEKNEKILFALDWQNGKKASELTECTEQMLGDYKELIYSKLVCILSDTAAPQKKSCYEIIERVKEYREKAGINISPPFWMACTMHQSSNSEKYTVEALSANTQKMLTYVSDLCAPTGKRYSRYTLHRPLELDRSSKDLAPLKMVPKKGCRFSFHSRNARTFFVNFEYFSSFFHSVADSSSHSNNDKLDWVLTKIDDRQQIVSIALDMIILVSFWVYFISPIWSFFATAKTARDTKAVLNAIRRFTSAGIVSKTPIAHLTKASQIFETIDVELKPPSDESLHFAEKFIHELEDWKVLGYEFTEKQYKSAEKTTSDIFGELSKKYEKEYSKFCDMEFSETDELRVILSSNQYTESVFGHFKDDRLSSNISDQVRFNRTMMVCNDSLNYAFCHEDSQKLIQEARKGRAKNKAKAKQAKNDNDDLYYFKFFDNHIEDDE